MTEPKPSAWLYDKKKASGTISRQVLDFCSPVRRASGWTETPLYTREAIEAEIVAWLREMKRDDTNWPQVIAGKIERGEYRSKSDGLD